MVTIQELYAGVRPGEVDTIEAVLADLEHLPLTSEIARLAGTFVLTYQKSYGLDDLDAIIAASAVQYKLKLQTLNLKHFPMFPELERAY